MTGNRNTTPADIWDVLRRLHLCNRQQLAARLGVTARTLRRWEQGEAGATAYRAAADLLQASLRAAKDADTLAQWRIDLDQLRDVAGRE